MFIAKDVAEALGYVDPAKAVRTHCKRGGRFALPSAGGSQEMVVIPEADVYRLVFRSKLENAEKFQDWVMEVVLPSLRKDGGYVMNQENMCPLARIAATLEFAHGVIAKQQQAIRDRALRGVMVGPKQLVTYPVRLPAP